MADEQDQSSILERKLVTILSADVAEYSRLMAEDEEHTLRIFRQHSETFRALVDMHHGRIFNTAGDAILAEFASPVEAVRCATDIQAALRSRNDLLPANRQVKFRIGVNLGDVMMQNSDLLGDGVNVAARLQGAAEPGGICLSGSVYDQIRNKLSLNIESLGERHYKNIPLPVRTFTIGGTEGRAARAKTSFQPPSKAVMGGIAVALLVLVAGFWATHRKPAAVSAPAPVVAAAPKPAPAPVKIVAKPVTLDGEAAGLLADATRINRPAREIQALTDADNKIAGLTARLQKLGTRPADKQAADTLAAEMKTTAAAMAHTEITALTRAAKAMGRDIAVPPARPAADAAAAIAAVTDAKSKFDDALSAAGQAADETASLTAARQALGAFDAFSTAYTAAAPVYVAARRKDFTALSTAAHATGDRLVAMGKVDKPFLLASRARRDAWQTLSTNAAQVAPQLAQLDGLANGAVASNDLGKIGAALAEAATIKVRLEGLLATSTAAAEVYSK